MTRPRPAPGLASCLGIVLLGWALLALLVGSAIGTYGFIRGWW